MAEERLTRMRTFISQYGLGASFAGVIVTGVLVVGVISTVNAVSWVGQVFPGFLLNERMALATIGQNQWTGADVGIKYPDKVLAADGIAIHSMPELLDILERKGVGESVTYEVEQDGNIIQVSVETMRFTWSDLFMTFGITFLVGMFYLGTGVSVLILKFNTKVSWAFFIACILLSVYSVTLFDMQSTHYGFIKIYIVATTFFPASLIHFSMHFPSPSERVRRRPSLEFFPYLVSLALVIPILILYPSDQVVHIWNAVQVYLALGNLAILYATLKEVIKQTSVIAKQRAKVLLAGAAVAFPLPAIAWLSQYFTGDFLGVKIQANLLSVPITAFPAAIAYSIVRHNLFDVDVYLKRALGYAIMIATVALGYFAIQTATVTFVLDPLFGAAAQKAYPVIFAFLIVFLYNPLNRRVQHGVDRLFYRAKLNYKHAVIRVTEALASMLDTRAIMRQIIQTVRGEMFVDSAGVITMNPDTNTCLRLFVGDPFGGDGKARESEECGNCDDPLLAVLAREKRLITKYDIDEDPHFLDDKEPCSKRFSEMSASLLIPLVLQGELRGALALGYKKSGKFFTREDVELLETIANEGAVAIENARMVEQIKQDELVRTNLSRYLSPQVVEKVVNQDVSINLGGNRKKVTVLFADIRNFTSILETRPADQLVEILNSYFTEMAEVIFANNGSLDKYIGDAIVAVFGSLIEMDNPTQGAVNAAVRMQRKMPELNALWQKKYGFGMEMGIGINSGEVFLGNIGSPERMEFTVIGDTVNVASRFSALAKGGQILLTRSALDELGTGSLCSALPKEVIKGKAEKMEIFEVQYEIAG